MTSDECTRGTDRYGPADVTCPYCGEWMVVDLEAESSGHKSSDAIRADGGAVEDDTEHHKKLRWCEGCQANVKPTWAGIGLECPFCSLKMPLIDWSEDTGTDKTEAGEQ